MQPQFSKVGWDWRWWNETLTSDQITPRVRYLSPVGHDPFVTIYLSVTIHGLWGVDVGLSPSKQCCMIASKSVSQPNWRNSVVITPNRRQIQVQWFDCLLMLSV